MVMARTAQSLSWTQAVILLGVLLWSLPAVAQTREVCSRTGQLMISMIFATDGNLADDRNKVSEAVKDPPGQYVTSCVQLQEQSAIQNSKNERKGQWFGFTPPEYRTLPVEPLHLRALYDDCRGSTCSHDQAFLTLLLKVCKEQLGRSDKSCEDELNKKPPASKPPLPVWRKGIGGALLGVGGLVIVLGAIHLGVPLFRTTGGCIEYGLEHPCVADRFGVGGALLGVGLATAGGGILALTLP